MAKVLIIDDDPLICDIICRTISGQGHQAVCAHTLVEGRRQALDGEFDAVFLDVKLPDGNGLDALPGIREKPSRPEVIIITGKGTQDGAEIAIANGAWDYLPKPLSIKDVRLALGRVLQYRESLQQVDRKPVVALKFKGVCGGSAVMHTCVDALARAANSDAAVLITGETGTGKEHFARAVHDNSSRADGNFVVVDCAALPETLAESLLFGHERGAFTGAERAKDGIISQADGGTLFLDELGELSLSLQKIFLRVLQERSYRPVGGLKELTSDFRLVAVTNRNLERLVEEGSFRQDLLYRVRAMTIELPPLRKRPEDIRDLVVYYVARICDRYGLESKGLSTDFLDALTAYNWPGNIRELINVLEGAISSGRREPKLFAKHLPTQLRIKLAKAAVAKQAPGNRPPLPAAEDPADSLPPLRDVRESIVADVEKEYFQKLMAATKGSIKEACRISGLSRTQLYTLMKRHDISRTGWQASS